jgi:hypothetical protein
MLTYADVCCIYLRELSVELEEVCDSLQTLHLYIYSIRQRMSAYVSIRQHTSELEEVCDSLQTLHLYAYVYIEHTSAYASIRQHTLAYVSIR